MQKYKFIKDEGKFIWSNDIIKLQFSEPSIQRWNEFRPGKIKDNGILYYYYKIEILKKICTNYDDDNDEFIYDWKLVSSRNTHDFPKIQQLQSILNYIIKLNPTENGQKINYRSGNVEYRETIHTEGFACDDFYEITKFTDDKGLNPRYHLYIGCTFDSQGDCNSSGIRTEYVSEKDLKQLLKCVNGFIKFSIDESNKEIAEYNSLNTSNKELIDGQLIQYALNNYTVLNKDKIDNIYVVGDILDICVVSKSFESYRGFKITDINDEYVCFKDSMNVKASDIVHIFNQVPNDKLSYNINEIADDFYLILTDIQKEEFKNKEIDFIFNKYREAIVNRTWMNRDEHNLPCSVDEAVKKIIVIIKNK